MISREKALSTMDWLYKVLSEKNGYEAQISEAIDFAIRALEECEIDFAEPRTKPLYSGLVVCLDNECYPHLTTGKIYEIKEGKFHCDSEKYIEGLHSYEEFLERILYGIWVQIPYSENEKRKDPYNTCVIRSFEQRDDVGLFKPDHIYYVCNGYFVDDCGEAPARIRGERFRNIAELNEYSWDKWGVTWIEIKN